MQCTDFQGKQELVSRLDAAVRLEQVEEITSGVKDALVDLIGRRAFVLPESVCRPAEGCYARRLVHRSDDLGYTVVAMVWGENQGTALHDHDGSWCVEGVVDGEISVTQYDLLEQAGQRWRFRRCDTISGLVGSAGTLIPPYDYHTIANSRTDGGASVTLHVYGTELKECGVFLGGEDGWYDYQTRSLTYTDS